MLTHIITSCRKHSSKDPQLLKTSFLLLPYQGLLLDFSGVASGGWHGPGSPEVASAVGERRLLGVVFWVKTMIGVAFLKLAGHDTIAVAA